jgi:hypothetical protein
MNATMGGHHLLRGVRSFGCLTYFRSSNRCITTRTWYGSCSIHSISLRYPSSDRFDKILRRSSLVSLTLLTRGEAGSRTHPCVCIGCLPGSSLADPSAFRTISRIQKHAAPEGKLDRRARIGEGSKHLLPSSRFFRPLVDENRHLLIPSIASSESVLHLVIVMSKEQQEREV